ncbi:MAG: hypothetical protein H0U34_09985 [Sphingomonas sp.]|nr:hypothetical protein [Sphingomonas sp.]
MNPDSATKTCSSIISYLPGPDGTLVETGEVLISPDQPITLEIVSVGKVEGGAICGAVELADMQKGQLRINGTLLPPDRNTAALSKLLEKMKPMAGRKACEGLQVENGQLMKYGQVERIDLNLPGKPVRWISPSEGYRVAPRTQSN